MMPIFTAYKEIVFLYDEFLLSLGQCTIYTQGHCICNLKVVLAQKVLQCFSLQYKTNIKQIYMVLYLVKLQSCILICLKLVEMSFKKTFSHFTETCMLYGTLVQVCIHLMSFREDVPQQIFVLVPGVMFLKIGGKFSYYKPICHILEKH